MQIGERVGTPGSRIAGRRRTLEMTQQQLCERVLFRGRPLSKRYLSKIENNEANPSAYLMDLLASALDTSPNFILRGEE